MNKRYTKFSSLWEGQKTLVCTSNTAVGVLGMQNCQCLEGRGRVTVKRNQTWNRTAHQRKRSIRDIGKKFVQKLSLFNYQSDVSINFFLVQSHWWIRPSKDMEASSSKGLVNFLKQICFYINSINILLASIFKCLAYAKYHLECLYALSNLILTINSMRQVLQLSSFYKWESWGLERLGSLSKVTQVLRKETRLETQVSLRPKSML